MAVETLDRTRIITIPEAGGEAEAAELRARDEATKANLQAYQIAVSNPPGTTDGFAPTTEHLIDVPEQPDTATAPAGLFDDLDAVPSAFMGHGEYRAVQMTQALGRTSTIEIPERGWQVVGWGLEAVGKVGELGVKGVMGFMEMRKHTERFGRWALSRGPLASRERAPALERQHIIQRFQDTRPFVMQSRRT